MSCDHLQASAPPLSNSPGTPQNEDWDRWIRESSPQSSSQNSVQFPGRDSEPDTQQEVSGVASNKSKRTLSELLKLHAERGTDVNFSPEEADRVAEVLGQWINSSSSPYEADDDFFAPPYSQDDSSLPSAKRSGASDSSGRPRGQSESIVRMPS